MAKVVARGSARWRSLTPELRLILGYLALVTIILTPLADWVSGKATRHVMQQAAAKDALMVTARLAPLLHGRDSLATLSADTGQQLLALMGSELAADGLRLLAIWDRSGTAVFRSPASAAANSSAQLTAGESETIWSGALHVNLIEMASGSHNSGLAPTSPVLRELVPLRSGGNAVLGVLVCERDASFIMADLRWARLESWIGVILAALALLTALVGLLRRGSRSAEVARTSSYAAFAVEQRQSADADQAGGTAAGLRSEAMQHYVLNENLLRRIGTDLHDGPAQLLSLALLRLDGLEGLSCGAHSDGKRQCANHLNVSRQALVDCMQQIRLTSNRLAIPNDNSLGLQEMLGIAVRQFSDLSGYDVECDFEPIRSEPDTALKLCLYRAVQEGLSNILRHAPGSRTRIIVRQIGNRLALVVTDDGQGHTDPNVIAKGQWIDGNHSRLENSQLGLRLLRSWVEALGGTMTIDFSKGRGTELNVQFNLSDDAAG